MNLSSLLQYQNHTAGQTTEAARAASSGGSQSGQGISGLSSGQMVRGEVIGRNGTDIQIRMEQGGVLHARMDREMQVPMGQSLTFEIKSISGEQVALRPLYENLAQDGNVMKALEAARLPASQEMMRMVSAMMRQGMSIDKNALMEMSRLVMANGKASPETVVMLKQLQLPVTPENIQQFENYQRCEHQLTQQVSQFLSELPDGLHSLIRGGQGGAALDLYTQILEVFQSQTGIQEDGVSAGGTRVFSDLVGTQGEVVPEQKALPTGEGRLPGMDTSVLSGQRPDTVLMPEFSGSTGMDQSAVFSSGEPLNMVLGQQGRVELAACMGKLGIGEEQAAQILKGEIPVARVLQEVQTLLKGSAQLSDPGSLQELLQSREVHQLLKHEILNQWLLRPEEAGSKQKLEEFYGKLREQTARLAESFSHVLKDHPSAKIVTQMQHNMDFMNQMNQAFHYIQLPLKMAGGETHGDLYVYTNKRASAKEDGSVSALLHLDMEHLGAMDIHVRMQEKNVTTKFYLSNESMIDFIGANIHRLNERLNQRGYSLQAEMIPSEESDAEDVIGRITGGESRTTLLAQYSFDARA